MEPKIANQHSEVEENNTGFKDTNAGMVKLRFALTWIRMIQGWKRIESWGEPDYRQQHWQICKLWRRLFQPDALASQRGDFKLLTSRHGHIHRVKVAQCCCTVSCSEVLHCATTVEAARITVPDAHFVTIHCTNTHRSPSAHSLEPKAPFRLTPIFHLQQPLSSTQRYVLSLTTWGRFDCRSASHVKSSQVSSHGESHPILLVEASS